NKSGIKKTSEKFELKNALCLLAAGVCIALVSTSYCISLQNVPAYIAVILLFQFTWIGALIESIAERKLPNRHTVAAIIILLTGTVLSAGVIGNEVELNAAGVFFGFLSAFFYALYIFLIGKSDENINPLNRSFIIISCALLVLIIIFSPSYFTSGVILEGLWVYGLLLGSIGCALPIFLFSIGTVRISATAGTILSSSEHPASIICAVIISSEPISALQWIGIVMILYGILHPYLAKSIKSKKPILHNSE
ncbi:MAG TPA: DMT family transporter, partial [Methanocorpusculum sp.]|nr:DMT family transporter [Methanocorpusculum sp.]